MNNTTSTTETVEALKLNITNHVPFEAVGDIKITSTNELAKTINNVFSKVFDDYYGCRLTVQFQPERGGYFIIPLLYFKLADPAKVADNGVYAFKPLGVENADNIIGRVCRYSQTAVTGQKATISDEGKSVLEDFIINPGKGKFDWATAYRTINTENGVVVESFKLDINKFITKIFGDTDEFDSKVFYQITPTYVIGGNNQYKTSTNWALHILRLHQNTQCEAAEMLGFYIPNQGLDIPDVITEVK